MSLDDSNERFSLLEMDLPGRAQGPVEREISQALAVVSAPIAAPTVNRDQARIDALPVRTSSPGLPYRRPPNVVTAPPIANDRPATQWAIADEELTNGSGVGVGWGGRGDLARSVVSKICEDLGLPLPRSRSEKAHASVAIAATAHGVYKSTPVKGSPEWVITDHTLPHDVQPFLTVRLDSGALTIEQKTQSIAATQLKEKILFEFQRRIDAEILTCTDVTTWCENVLRSLGGIPVAVLWYVPARNVQKAKDFAAAMQKIWGHSWTSPPMPMVKSNELAENLVNGFRIECEALMVTLKESIGPRGAASMVGKIETLREKCRGYRAMLGDSRVADIQKNLDDAINSVKEKCTDVDQRGQMLELT